MNSDRPIAVITGASRGLGLETGRQLLARGCHVILTARDGAAAEAAAAALGAHAEGHALDVSRDDAVAAFFDWLRQSHGRIDVLVNNAGRIYAGKSNLKSASAADMADAIDNNALSAWRMSAQALPMMNAAGHGRIVNVSSGMGSLVEMGSGSAAYRISKVAMNSVTRLAANEARGDVKVNSVCPGWVRTDMGGKSATRAVEEGAASIVWAAVLPADGPNGGFFRDGKPIPW
jgi:NAD(P)-dependent dehydrogenase (short-subunit alcohol dehydrogenase family)